jgi:hypothetical protein
MHVDSPTTGSERRGVIDGGARILGELLRTPRIVKTARIVLSNLDPEAAPTLVRTVMYADSMLFFDVVSAAPALANAAVLGTREVCEQLLALPEELLHRFIPRLLEEVSAEQLGEAAGLAVLAVGRVASSPDGSLAERARAFETDFKRGLQKGLSRDEELVGRQVTWLADTIVRVARENQRLMKQVVRPLVNACRQALQEGDDA